MAPKATAHRKRDKLLEFFHLRPRTPPLTPSSLSIATMQPTTAPLPPPQLAGNIEPPVLNPHDIEPASTKREKVFTRGKSFKKDMAILSIAYTLQKDPELKSLIQLIVVIRDNDSKDQVMSAMYTAYRSPTVLSFSLPTFSKPALGSAFSLHLLRMYSVQERHRRSRCSKSKNLAVIVHGPGRSECLHPSFRTLAKLKAMQLNGDDKSFDEVMITINEDIERIKVSLDILVCPPTIHTSFSLHS